MLHKLVIPGGQTSGQSTLAKWNKNPGDEVVKWDVIAEVETDKTVLDIECPVRKGIFLGGYFAEGDVISAGTVIGYIGDVEDELPPKEGSAAKETIEEVKEMANPLPEEQESQIASSLPEATIKATPGAKRLAKANNINLEEIKSSAPVINEDDVKAFINDPHINTVPGAMEMPLGQKEVAAALMSSLTQTAQYNITFKVDATICLNALKWINSGKNKSERITLNDLVMKAACVAIEEYPLINQFYSPEGVTRNKSINFGFAISVGSSLIVPVLKNAGGKSIWQIAKGNKENIALVRSGKYDHSMIVGGTITLSGVGNLGVYHSVAILNSRESCILVVNAVLDDVKIENGEIVAYKSFLLTGTFDHRLINGGYAAQFMGKVKELLEETEPLLV